MSGSLCMVTAAFLAAANILYHLWLLLGPVQETYAQNNAICLESRSARLFCV